MSAVIVDRASVDVLVTAMVRYEIVDPAAASAAGSNLVQANVDALHAPWRPETVPAYFYRPTQAPVGQIAKTLRHFIYQASEASDWLDSAARDMCCRLAVALLDQVPGYRESVWQ